jgi:hypothetical protein
MRDEFTSPTIRTLAARAGYRCSNPDCRKPTAGPHTDARKAANIGVAAHITAASLGGPRYDTVLTEQERKDISNAIWLCQNCARHIDNDEKRFPVELLLEWKKISEEEAFRQISSSGTKSYTNTITELPTGRIGIRMKGGSGKFGKLKIRNQSISIDAEDAAFELGEADIG